MFGWKEVVLYSKVWKEGSMKCRIGQWGRKAVCIKEGINSYSKK